MQKGNEKAFQSLFHKYFSFLVQIAFKQCGNKQIAHDSAQDVFVNLWKRKNEITLQSGIQAYLRRAVVYKTIDYIRAKKVNFNNIDDFEIGKSAPIEDKLITDELSVAIQEAMDTLPERCRIIFALSRYEQLTHQEISQQLNISKKTIENQITKALKHIRVQISPFLEK